MPIVITDLLWRGSVVTGTAGNSVAQTVPGSHRGKYASTTVITDAVVNNVFPDVTGDENLASQVDYQCVFIHNNHATLTLQLPVLWLSSEVAGGAGMAVAVDNIPASAIAASTIQAATIATKNTAPVGVGPFSSPTTKVDGLAVGNLGPGQVRAIWVRRTSANSAALNNDGATLRVEGDTAA